MQAKGAKTRRFLVDNGASFHLVSKETLSQKERKTFRKIPFPIEIQTRNGKEHRSPNIEQPLEKYGL